jgi:hypothetical protein
VKAFGIQFTGQVLLGQRRPLVGQVGFVTDQHDPAGKLFLLQRGHDLPGCMSRAGDYNGFSQLCGPL